MLRESFFSVFRFHSVRCMYICVLCPASILSVLLHVHIFPILVSLSNTGGRVHITFNVCFAYHYPPLFSTHTHTHTIAIFFFLHASNFHGVTFEMLPSCQDKSSTKAHKLVHNYMRARTASRLGVSTKREKRKEKKEGDQSAEQ
jgi:hypothetical protein